MGKKAAWQSPKLLHSPKQQIKSPLRGDINFKTFLNNDWSVFVALTENCQVLKVGQQLLKNDSQ